MKRSPSGNTGRNGHWENLSNDDSFPEGRNEGAPFQDSSSTTTFIMSAQAVTVTANFETIPTSTGDGGNYNRLPIPHGGAAQQGRRRGGRFPSRPERGDTTTVTPKPDEVYKVGKITVTDKSCKPVEVKVRSDDTYTFKQPIMGTNT